MKKDSYYFPHFDNARNDRKIMKIRRVLGLEGYAIYFMILEVLRSQTGFKFPIDGVSELEYEFRVSKEKILSVINDYDLFTIDNDNFFSIKLITYLQPYLEKSERARQAALKRWNNANAYANALPEHSKCNANQNASKGKERKQKESKEENKYDLFKKKNPQNYSDQEKEVLFNKIRNELLNDKKWIFKAAKALKISEAAARKKVKSFVDFVIAGQEEKLFQKITSIKAYCMNWIKINK